MRTALGAQGKLENSRRSETLVQRAQAEINTL
jgi:hypothetical protein